MLNVFSTPYGKIFPESYDIRVYMSTNFTLDWNHACLPFLDFTNKSITHPMGLSSTLYLSNLNEYDM